MTAGVLEIISPYGRRVHGLLEISADSGAHVTGAHEVIAGGGRIVGRLLAIAPFLQRFIDSPAVSLTTRAGDGGQARFGQRQLTDNPDPIKYQIRYSAGDFAWELAADFPMAVDPEAISVTISGQPLTFSVISGETRIDPDRQSRSVRATMSIEDHLTREFCIDGFSGFQSVSRFVGQMLPDLSIDWRAISYVLTPQILYGLSVRPSTRLDVLRQLLRLASADLVLRPDGGVLVRDIAPDRWVEAQELNLPVLSIRERPGPPVETTGVVVAVYGDDPGAPYLEHEVENQSTDERPRYILRVFASPEAELVSVHQSPASPVLHVFETRRDIEHVETRLEFRGGVARTRPRLFSYKQGIFNPASGWSHVTVPAVSILEWLGQDLGGITALENGLIFADVRGDSIARAAVNRSVQRFVITNDIAAGAALPAGWSWWDHADGDISVQITLSQKDAPSSVSLVRTGDDGKIADKPILAPNARLIPYTGQRWMRVQNARRVEITVAGEAMGSIGRVVDVKGRKIIIDDGMLHVASDQTITQLSGRAID